MGAVPGFVFDSAANFVRTPNNGYGFRLYGSTSGSVGFKPAAIAGSADYILPAADATVSGQALISDGSGNLAWATIDLSTLVALVPTTSARNIITPASSTVVPLTITLASSQSANALNINTYGNTGGSLLALTAGGTITFSASGVASSGTDYAVKITPTYNQTSTAGSTDLLINRTQTAVGSGTHKFIDCQVAGTSQAIVRNDGMFASINGFNVVSTIAGNAPVCGMRASGQFFSNSTGVPMFSAGSAGTNYMAFGNADAHTWTFAYGASITALGTAVLTLTDNGPITMSPVTGVIVSSSGAVSTPVLTGTGTWYSGGSATTTKPYCLLEPTGTTSTGWSTSGTGFGINAASGFAGRAIDVQRIGLSCFYVEPSTSGVAGYTVAKISSTATSQPLQLAFHTFDNKDYVFSLVAGGNQIITGSIGDEMCFRAVNSQATLFSADNGNTINFSVLAGGTGVSVRQTVKTSGSPTALLVTGAAHTTLAASTESIGANFNFSATKQFATGAIATQREVVFQAPTYAFVGASTITSAATLAITAAPIAGTNATITNKYALWIQGGNLNMDTGSSSYFKVDTTTSTGITTIYGSNLGSGGAYITLCDVNYGKFAIRSGQNNTFIVADNNGLSFGVGNVANVLVLSGAIATFSATGASSSGTDYAVKITQTYNQTSTAGATDLLINRTQTAVGSGSQNFLDCQVATVSKASISNTGRGTFTGVTSNGDILLSAGNSIVMSYPTNNYGNYGITHDTSNDALCLLAYGNRNLIIGTADFAGNNTLSLGHAYIAFNFGQFGVPYSSAPIGSYWGLGIASATKTTWPIYGTCGIGSNIAGTNLVLGGGPGTGTGVGGDFIVNYFAAGTTGSSVNATAAPAVTVNGNTGVLTATTTGVASSGTDYAVKITPTYNQTSTAGASDLYIRRTETAVGSGSQYLIDAGVSSTLFGVSNKGATTITVSSTTSTPLTVTGATSQSVASIKSVLGSSQTGNHLTCYNSDGTTATLNITSAGKIGINTTPSAHIHVFQGSSDVAIRIDSTGNYQELDFYQGATAVAAIWTQSSAPGAVYGGTKSLNFYDYSGGNGFAWAAGSSTPTMYLSGGGRLQVGGLAAGCAATPTALSGTFAPTGSAASGTDTAFAITPTYNQTSTAGSTDLLINRTQTAVGSGTHNFIDCQVAGTSRLNISNVGLVTQTLKNTSTTTTGTSAFSGIHIAPQGTNGTFAGITFGGAGVNATQTQAGILSVCNSGTGSDLQFFTANSYASGMQQRGKFAANGDFTCNTTITGGVLYASYSGSNTLGYNGGGVLIGNGSGGITLRYNTSGSFCIDTYNTTPAWQESMTITRNGATTHTPTARASGVASYFSVYTPADTTLTLSTESIGIQLGGNSSAATVTRQWATGALTTQRENVFVAPTYGFVGASTITNAATVSITGAPIAGTNTTITNAYALLTESGRVHFKGSSGNLEATVLLKSEITSGSGCGLYCKSATTSSYTYVAIGNDIQTSAYLGLGWCGAANQWGTGTAQFDSIIQYYNSGSSRLIFSDNANTTFPLAMKTAAVGAGLVGINNLTPVATLDITQGVRTSGSPTALLITGAAHTTLTASTESIGVNFNFSATKQFATGALTTQREVVFQAPTYAFVGASTITNAATVSITGAPVAGTNATITNPWALNVEAGRTQFPYNSTGSKSSVYIGGGTTTPTSNPYQLLVSASSGDTNVGLLAATTGNYIELDIGAWNYIFTRDSGLTSSYAGNGSLVFQTNNAGSHSNGFGWMGTTNGAIPWMYLSGGGLLQVGGLSAGCAATPVAGIVSAINGAASSSGLAVTGTWFSGGTATTTKPQVLIETAGTTSTGWNTSGTGLGINAANGWAGMHLDCQYAGVSIADLFYTSSAGGGILRLKGLTSGKSSGSFYFDGPDTSNAAYAAFGVASTGTYFGVTGYTIFSSSKNGTGTQLPMTFGGYSGSWSHWMTITTGGLVAINRSTTSSAQLDILSSGSTVPGLMVTGATSQSVTSIKSVLGSSQTGNHLTCYNSDGTTISAYIDYAGNLQTSNWGTNTFVAGGGGKYGSTSSAESVYIGAVAGAAATGTNNVVVGSRACRYATSISNSVAIGEIVGGGGGGGIPTGGDWVAIGYNSCASMTTSTGNVAIGSYSNSTSNRNNVLLTTGTYNVVLGYAAGTKANNTSFGVAIGPGAQTASNCFVSGSGQEASATQAIISNVYFGSGITDPSPQPYIINGSGGSGTNIAGAAISIAGGQGTGTGVGGNVNVQVALPGTTGSSLNALTTVATWSGTNGGLTLVYPLTAAFACTEVTSTSQSASVNNTYIANNSALVTITLPSTAAQGSWIEIVGKGNGGWRIAQNSGQVIHFGSVDTTTGTGGHLDSNQRYDSIGLVCVTANTDWVVISTQGNISYT